MAYRTDNRSPRRGLGRAPSWALAAGAALALLAPADAAATPATFTFIPPNAGWVPARLAGVPVNDPAGDIQGPRDIVGDAANPMLFIASDATHLYLRLRLDGDPAQTPTNFKPFGWGCFIDTDSTTTTYEFSTIVDGVGNPDKIAFFKNTVTATPNSPNDPPDLPAVSLVSAPLTAAIGHARVVSAPSMFSGDADFFIDWAVERSAALGAGFNPSNPARYYCGSSNNGTTIAADCSGGTAGGCLLSSQLSDPISCGPTGCGACGDGTVGGAEGCDDGNLVNGDGCDAMCLREISQPCALAAQCASALCDPASNTCACDQDADCSAGQVCNTTSNPNICVTPGCGNGLIEAGEACDDGNMTSGDGCNAACLGEIGQPCMDAPTCASGFCDPAGGTCACDEDADCGAGQVCDTTPDPNVCAPGGCGNGKIESGEGCDDQNTTSSDGCSATCMVEPMWTCTGAPSVCTPVTGCTTNTECPEGRVCDAGTCVECAKDSDCPSGKVCDETAHICGGCFSDADCTSGATCATASRTCGPPDSVHATGNGLTCSLGIERSGDEGLAVGMMSLLALTARRLRRRASKEAIPVGRPEPG